MRVTQIPRMKSFGVFRDHKWDGTPDFKRFNLIYGWNRSGKTTFSRVLSACEKRSTDFDQYPDGGSFEVSTDTGSRIRSSNLDDCALSVRVFNQDFIDENVSFDSHACHPIVYVSKEDIDAKKELDRLTGLTDGLDTAFEAARRGRVSAEKVVTEFQEATALNIKNTVGNLSVPDQYRTYDKSKLKALIESGDELSELSSKDFETFKTVISSGAKQKLPSVSAFDITMVMNAHTVTSATELHETVSRLASRKVVSETLERLKEDQELNDWVKRGFELQVAKKNNESCLFCGRSLDEDFMPRLSRHFSHDYNDLVLAVEGCLRSVRAGKKEQVEVSNDIYLEPESSFETDLASLNDLIADFNAWLDKCCDVLQLKLDNPLGVFDPPEVLSSDFERNYATLARRLNEAIDIHNTKVDHHDDEVKLKKDQLAKHILAVAMRTQKYSSLIEDVESAQKAEAMAKEAFDGNKEQIDKLTTRTSNVARAIEKINEHLEGLFGGKEVRLALDPDSKDYMIERDGNVANSLSEGEKTAIAFAYFLAKVQERDFKVTDGIVVIDDPISSLDSNFIFQINALIRRHFGSAGQLFVMTHNFELLNLVKARFKRRNAKCVKKGQEPCCEFYCVENTIEDKRRTACIKPMDATLRDFNSEYQYLFVRLWQFKNAKHVTYEDLYTIGNIARRFLEVFASFKIPTTGDLRSKVEQLPTKTVDDAQKDKVYNLVQEFSHLQDPLGGIMHKDRCEAQEAARLLLKIVEESDPTHYGLMEKTVPDPSLLEPSNAGSRSAGGS